MNADTDLLQAELTQANALLRTVIDENPNIIFMKDWEGKFLIGNRALAALYGTTPDNLVGKDDGAFNTNAEQVDFFLKNVQEIMSQSATQVVMEESTHAVTGDVTYFQSIKKPLTTKDGKKQILVIANDVSEIKRVQQRLEESERRLRYVLEATREGVWDWDIKTGVVTHNQQWCRIAGLDDPYLQHPLEVFSSMLHDDDNALVMARLQSCLSGEGRYQSEHRMRWPDGRVVWVLDRGDVVERDSDGAPLRMVGSFVDISERKAGELALSVRTELSNAIFELSPDGFISFDDARRVSYVSPAFTRMTGIEAAQLHGLDEEHFTDLLAQRCATHGRFRGVDALRQSINQNTPDERALIELATADKRILEVGLRVSEASTVSQILYFRDVTHETEVDQMKSEFLSTAAHELRTPMASIFGFAEVLLTHELDPASHREFLEIIFTQAGLMSSILNELLDLARIEARRGKDFVIEVTKAQAVLNAVVKGFKVPVGQSVPTQRVPDEPVYILADFKKAQQAIMNVLSNAYKYSPQGARVSIGMDVVTEDVPAAGQGPSSAMVAIRIVDEGIGMTPEQTKRVFERFYRADASGTVPGTGLGMSIVKEIVDLHHGRVEIQSQIGLGTTVTLMFPAGENRAEPAAQ